MASVPIVSLLLALLYPMVNADLMIDAKMDIAVLLSVAEHEYEGHHQKVAYKQLPTTFKLGEDKAQLAIVLAVQREEGEGWIMLNLTNDSLAYNEQLDNWTFVLTTGGPKIETSTASQPISKMSTTTEQQIGNVTWSEVENGTLRGENETLRMENETTGQSENTTTPPWRLRRQIVSTSVSSPNVPSTVKMRTQATSAEATTVKRDTRATSAKATTVKRDTRTTSTMATTVKRDTRATSAKATTVKRDTRTTSTMATTVKRDTRTTSTMATTVKRDTQATESKTQTGTTSPEARSNATSTEFGHENATKIGNETETETTGTKSATEQETTETEDETKPFRIDLAQAFRAIREQVFADSVNRAKVVIMVMPPYFRNRERAIQQAKMLTDSGVSLYIMVNQKGQHLVDNGGYANDLTTREKVIQVMRYNFLGAIKQICDKILQLGLCKWKAMCLYKTKVECALDASLPAHLPHVNNREQCDAAKPRDDCTVKACNEKCDKTWPWEKKPDCGKHCGGTAEGKRRGEAPPHMQNCPTTEVCGTCTPPPPGPPPTGLPPPGPQSTGPEEPKSEGPNIGLIIGLVVVIIAFLALAGVGFMCWMKHRAASTVEAETAAEPGEKLPAEKGAEIAEEEAAQPKGPPPAPAPLAPEPPAPAPPALTPAAGSVALKGPLAMKSGLEGGVAADLLEPATTEKGKRPCPMKKAAPTVMTVKTAPPAVPLKKALSAVTTPMKGSQLMKSQTSSDKSISIKSTSITSDRMPTKAAAKQSTPPVKAPLGVAKQPMVLAKSPKVGGQPVKQPMVKAQAVGAKQPVKVPVAGAKQPMAPGKLPVMAGQMTQQTAPVKSPVKQPAKLPVRGGSQLSK